MYTDPAPADKDPTEAEASENRRLIHLWIEQNFGNWRSRAEQMAYELELPWEEAFDCLVKTVINTADLIEREALRLAVRFADETVIWEFVEQLMADRKLAIINYLRWRMLDLRRQLKNRSSLFVTFADIPVSEDDPEFDPSSESSQSLPEIREDLRDNAEGLEREIALLRSNQQIVIRRRIKGWSFDKISELVGKSPVATEGHYHRGRRVLSPASQRLLDALVKEATNNPNL
jgi:hypothetical protein